MPKPGTAYPERTGLSLPPGSLAKIDTQAASAGQSRGDWLRAIVRRALESAERQGRRQSAAS